MRPVSQRPTPKTGAFTASTRATAMLAAMAAAMAAALAAGAPQARAQAEAAKADKSCAAYGTDFQKVPGTTSCVRTGAAVRTDVYGGRVIGSAPNQFSGTPTGTSAPEAPAAVDPWKATR